MFLVTSNSLEYIVKCTFCLLKYMVDSTYSKGNTTIIYICCFHDDHLIWVFGLFFVCTTTLFIVAFVNIIRGMWPVSLMVFGGMVSGRVVVLVTSHVTPIHVWSEWDVFLFIRLWLDAVWGWQREWWWIMTLFVCVQVRLWLVRVETCSLSHWTEAWRRLEGGMSFGFVIVPHRLICKLWSNIWIWLGGYNNNHSRGMHVFTYKIPQYVHFVNLFLPLLYC